MTITKEQFEKLIVLTINLWELEFGDEADRIAKELFTLTEQISGMKLDPLPGEGE